MTKYPCLVLDHDNTVVRSEETVNYPYFCEFLDRFRPGIQITLREYLEGCYALGFSEMCRRKYHFTDKELVQEYVGWKQYTAVHIPAPYPGIQNILERQKENGGFICVVSHSCHDSILRDYNVNFKISPDEIFGWDLPDHCRKPNPYPLRQIMQKYQMQPQQLLVLDDTKSSIDMCHVTGVPLAFAAWGRAEDPKGQAEMNMLCDYSFATPAMLEKFLFCD